MNNQRISGAGSKNFRNVLKSCLVWRILVMVHLKRKFSLQKCRSANLKVTGRSRTRHSVLVQVILWETISVSDPSTKSLHTQPIQKQKTSFRQHVDRFICTLYYVVVSLQFFTYV